MLTNSQKRDRREWTIMNLFAQNCSSFPPKGELFKSERPDFIIKTPTARIGVELTELKYDRSEYSFNIRAHEDFLNSLIETALDIYNHNSPSPLTLLVDVQFDDSISNYIIDSKPVVCNAVNQSNTLELALAEAIARIVHENVPDATGKYYIVDRTSKYGDQHLPMLIRRINIHNVTGVLQEPLWYASIATHVKPMSVDSIKQRIADKTQKLLGYDQTCTSHWLIIVQNSFLTSSAYNPVEVQRALRHRYIAGFDAVYILERSAATVTRLRLKKP